MFDTHSGGPDDLQCYGYLRERRFRLVAARADHDPISPADIRSDFRQSTPEIAKRRQFWVLPAGPDKSHGFGAFHTQLKGSPEWDGLWRVGDEADMVVAFDDKPCRLARSGLLASDDGDMADPETRRRGHQQRGNHLDQFAVC